MRHATSTVKTHLAARNSNSVRENLANEHAMRLMPFESKVVYNEHADA